MQAGPGTGASGRGGRGPVFPVQPPLPVGAVCSSPLCWIAGSITCSSQEGLGSCLPLCASPEPSRHKVGVQLTQDGRLNHETWSFCQPGHPSAQGAATSLWCLAQDVSAVSRADTSELPVSLGSAEVTGPKVIEPCLASLGSQTRPESRVALEEACGLPACP